MTLPKTVSRRAFVAASLSTAGLAVLAPHAFAQTGTVTLSTADQALVAKAAKGRGQTEECAISEVSEGEGISRKPASRKRPAGAKAAKRK